MTANGVTSALEVLDARRGGTQTPPLDISSSPKEREEAIRITAYVTTELNKRYESEASLTNKVLDDMTKVFQETERTINEVQKAQMTRDAVAPKALPSAKGKSLIEEVAEIEKNTRVQSGKLENPKPKSKGFFANLGRIFSCFLCCFGRQK